MVSAAPAPPQRQQTWLSEAQIRHQPIGNIPYDGGMQVVRFLEMPQAGYLSKIRAVTTLSGQLSANPVGVDAFAPAQASLAQIRVFVNSEGVLFDLDGNMAKLAGLLSDVYEGHDAQFLQFPQESFSLNPGTNLFTNKFFHHIPLGLNLNGVPFPLGLYNTALQNLTVRIEVRWLPLVAATGLPPGAGTYLGTAGALPAVTNVSGNIDFNEEYFEPIPIVSAQPPLRYVHRWTQFEVPINVTNGVVEVPLIGRQQYLRMLYAIVDAPTAANAYNDNIVTQLQLTHGVQSHVEDETIDQVRNRMRRQYGRLMNQWPGGVYTHDFVTETHNPRDWFDAGLTTNLRARITFNGAHAGVGSKIICATEEMLTLRGAGFAKTDAAVQASLRAGAAA